MPKQITACFERNNNSIRTLRSILFCRILQSLSFKQWYNPRISWRLWLPSWKRLPVFHHAQLSLIYATHKGVWLWAISTHTNDWGWCAQHYHICLSESELAVCYCTKSPQVSIQPCVLFSLKVKTNTKWLISSRELSPIIHPSMEKESMFIILPICNGWSLVYSIMTCHWEYSNEW